MNSGKSASRMEMGLFPLDLVLAELLQWSTKQESV